MTTAEDRPEIDWGQVEWKKATACGESVCVEVAMLGSSVAVRDSKDPARAPPVFSAREWSSFIRGVRQGEFDIAP